METQEILDRYRYTTKAQKDEIDRLRAVIERQDEELTQLRAWIDEPHAIGANDTHADGCRDVQDALLQFRARLVRLGEAGGDDHTAADTGIGTLLDRCQKLVRRDGEDRHLHAARRIGERRVRRVPQDLLPSRIYRHDAAGEAVVQQKVDDPPPKLFAILRRAEHRDGAGMQDRADRQPRRSHADATPAIRFRPYLFHTDAPIPLRSAQSCSL